MNSPRTDTGEGLADRRRFTLNIGAGRNGAGDVRLDISKDAKPDVRADACHLPFRSDAFGQALLLDVIEHIPIGCEPRAISEVARTLKSEGILVFSTPNGRASFKYSDPAYYRGHRHYTTEQVRKMLGRDFEIHALFTAGGWIAALVNVFAMGSRVTAPFGGWLSRFSKAEYTRQRPNDGYTIFAVCSKPPAISE